jgi:thiamine pyrophosphokinase
LKALIVADGDVPSRAVVDALLGSTTPDIVVAADGGALKATALGLPPHVVVGDADSLSATDVERLRADGVDVLVHPSDKDESDTELALREAIRRGAMDIVVVGAFGGTRLEHTIANLLLLTMPELDGLDVRLADAATEVRAVSGGSTLTLNGAAGDFVSLFPLAPVVDGVTTTGLEFALANDSLSQGPARGLSNVMNTDSATVTVRTGPLLVVHTRNHR